MVVVSARRTQCTHKTVTRGPWPPKKMHLALRCDGTRAKTSVHKEGQNRKAQKKRLTSLTLSHVLTRSGWGSHSSTTTSISRRVRHFDVRLTSRVVSIGSSSIAGGPGKTSTNGLLVRESPLGARTTGGSPAISNEPSYKTSSVSKGVRGVSGLEFDFVDILPSPFYENPKILFQYIQWY